MGSSEQNPAVAVACETSHDRRDKSDQRQPEQPSSTGREDQNTERRHQSTFKRLAADAEASEEERSASDLRSEDEETATMDVKLEDSDDEPDSTDGLLDLMVEEEPVKQERRHSPPSDVSPEPKRHQPDSVVDEESASYEARKEPQVEADDESENGPPNANMVSGASSSHEGATLSIVAAASDPEPQSNAERTTIFETAQEAQQYETKRHALDQVPDDDFVLVERDAKAWVIKLLDAFDDRQWLKILSLKSDKALGDKAKERQKAWQSNQDSNWKSIQQMLDGDVTLHSIKERTMWHIVTEVVTVHKKGYIALQKDEPQQKMTCSQRMAKVVEVIRAHTAVRMDIVKSTLNIHLLAAAPETLRQQKITNFCSNYTRKLTTQEGKQALAEAKKLVKESAGRHTGAGNDGETLPNAAATPVQQSSDPPPQAVTASRTTTMVPSTASTQANRGAPVHSAGPTVDSNSAKSPDAPAKVKEEEKESPKGLGSRDEPLYWDD